VLRQAAIASLLLVATPAAAAQASAEPSAMRVVVRGGAVTARLERAPLADVVSAIAEQTGAELRGELVAPGPVTLELQAVPLAEALERLLTVQSFTLTYRSDGRLKRITLGREAARGREANPKTSGRAGTTSSPSPESQEATRRVAEYVRGNETVPVGGRLGRALGTDTPTFQQILGTALKHEDPRVRAEARRVAVKALAADPEVRSALVTAVDGMPDETLVKALRGLAGDDAARLALAFARYGRSAALSMRMQRAISELRRQSDGS
jgi:hypothetical protein